MLQNQPGSLSGQDVRREGDESWSNTYLQDQTTASRKSPLAWWYRLTSPPEPAPGADFAAREATRRGLLASTLMFYLLLVLLIVFPLALISGNKFIPIAVSVVFVLGIIALVFNHRGHSNVTGLIIVIGLEAALFNVIRLAPGGLDPSSLGLFDILVLGEVFAASLLPINWVIVVALANVAFTVLELGVLARSTGDAMMLQMMQQSGMLVIFRPIIIHVVITTVLWLWVRSATRAIDRADRAEVIATLEHSIAEQEHSIAEEKRLIDLSIQKILQVQMRVSNGDFDARVPLVEGEPLWPVAGSLNNLLSRLQRLHQTEREVQQIAPRLQRAVRLEHEFQRIQSEVLYILQAMAAAEAEQRGLQMRKSGSLLDPLAAQLHGKYILSPQKQEIEPRNPSGKLPSFEPTNLIDNGWGTSARDNSRTNF
jgi:hypothetical protein